MGTLACPGRSFGTIGNSTALHVQGNDGVRVFAVDSAQTLYSGNALCATGYQGVMCARCSAGYFTSLSSCEMCPSYLNQTTHILYTVLLGCASVLVGSVLVWLLFQSRKPIFELWRQEAEAQYYEVRHEKVTFGRVTVKRVGVIRFIHVHSYLVP